MLENRRKVSLTVAYELDPETNRQAIFVAAGTKINFNLIVPRWLWKPDFSKSTKWIGKDSDGNSRARRWTMIVPCLRVTWMHHVPEDIWVQSLSIGLGIGKFNIAFMFTIRGAKPPKGVDVVALSGGEIEVGQSCFP